LEYPKAETGVSKEKSRVHDIPGKLKIELLHEPGAPQIHLQIRHSIEYAIGFGHLKPGDKLPSTRALAELLGIATNTVARAYRDLQDENLLMSRPGQGTFVQDVAKNGSSKIQGSSTLTSLLRPTLRSVLSIGFKREEIINAVNGLLRKSLVAFIGINQTIVDKWTAIMEQELGDLDIEIIGVTLEEMIDSRTEALKKIEDIHQVLTLVSTIDEVHAILQPYGKQIIPVISRLSTASHSALANLPCSGTIGLICREFYVSSLRGVLNAYVGLDRVRWVSPDNKEEIHRLSEVAECVVHTLASAKLVAALVPSHIELIELEFVPDKSSFQQLRESLG